MTVEGEKKTGPLSPNDPSSFSNPEQVSANRVELVWEVDFDRQVISGTATYHVVATNPAVEHMIFDIDGITIQKVEDLSNGAQLEYSLGKPVHVHGQPLNVKLPTLNAQNNGSLKIQYETSSTASSLQWLTKEQTLMKQLPYMFSQCQSIFARSLLPCQDTPSTKMSYSAQVLAIKDAEVLMSAVKGETTAISDTHRSHSFEQKIAIPSYLLAIVVGGIKNKRIGPRSVVWAEEDLLETAAFDFSDTEKMLQVGENLFGEYVWGVYDILVLPPSFPFGGMENPCLTFVTPTLLTGDKSLANVIAHEICHSWFGNLVTNTTFEHFWLNEGFTVFAERKILGALHGEKFRQFCLVGGLSSLTEDIKAYKFDNPLTKLVPNLDLCSPEDSFSRVPYDKGCTFLYYLEEKVGGPSVFEPFLKRHVALNRFKSIDTNAFKEQFIDYFTNSGNESMIVDVDWDGWLYNTGMPVVIPEYDTTLSDACSRLKSRWVTWDPNQTDDSPFKSEDISSLDPTQVVLFLGLLLNDDKMLGLEKIKAMQEAYDFNSSKNCDIYHRWLAVCLKHEWMDALPLALKYVSQNTRMKLIRPIYRELNKNAMMKAQAIENFAKIRSSMMHASVQCVLKDLSIE